ncbi:repressor of the inhibitor of the protein kinase [Chionoecetes opilio]|uniref:Repressor of the inhibitor of the protein kinase n=1 Tax=Chionoecetes opilio TaxID=41210 RepID=A0A8J4YK18_CHIOP|nr:repressor of the inhibitor of the protein kinase [Chionoecetes opilio]
MSLLKSCITGSIKKTLLKLCETRFVERHESIMTFASLLPFIVQALDEMKTWTSCETRKVALRLESSITNASFIVALNVLETVSGLLLPLTRILQSVSYDISQAMVHVSGLIDVLENIRSEGSEFTVVFKKASDLAEKVGVVITKPRAAQRSVYRKNAGVGSSIEDYYRINVFYPTVDAIIVDLKHRFGERQQTATGISCLIPSLMDFGIKKQEQWKSLLAVIETYHDCLDVTAADLHGEFELWRKQWQNSEERPQSALASLDSCYEYYPNIKTFLQMLATLPVTTAEPERLFSRMERTLTSIRVSMSEIRLQDLVLLQVNRRHAPSIDQVIDRLAATTARRLRFLL